MAFSPCEWQSVAVLAALGIGGDFAGKQIAPTLHPLGTVSLISSSRVLIAFGEGRSLRRPIGGPDGGETGRIPPLQL